VTTRSRPPKRYCLLKALEVVGLGRLKDIGVEYQHFELENKRASTETPVGGFDDSFDLKARGDIVRARLSVKTQGFGWVR
jgi:hypothetical protein